jgi:very-short-patch-repair endonuclease
VTTRRSDLEEIVAFQLRALRVDAPVREHVFHPGRRFRFDFAWPDRLVALEIDGGIWNVGRHTRGSGAVTDAEKYSLAAILGWRILRATERQVHSGEAARWVETILRGNA